MAQHIIYFIDQYIEDSFLSRSEPFYDRHECENVLFNLRSNITCDSSILYRISVSMPLEEYEQMELSSRKLKIKFINFDELGELHHNRLSRSRSPSPYDNSVTEEDNNDPLLESYVEDSHIQDSGYELLLNNYEKHKYQVQDQEKDLYNNQKDAEYQVDDDLVSLYDNDDYNDEFINLPEKYFAYKYKKGYIMKNKKKNRAFLRENCLIDHFYTLNEKFFFITEQTIKDNSIPFLDLVNVKKKTDKMKQDLLNI